MLSPGGPVHYIETCVSVSSLSARASRRARLALVSQRRAPSAIEPRSYYTLVVHIKKYSAADYVLHTLVCNTSMYCVVEYIPSRQLW